MSISHDSKDNLEKLFSNYLELVATIVYKPFDKERFDDNNRIWHPQGYFYKKLVDDYNNRIGVIHYDEIETWSRCECHGFVHGLMVGFLAFLHAGFLEQDGLQSTVQDDNSDYSPTSILYSCLLHDFVKGAFDQESNHDRLLKEYFPSCIPETFSHSNPSDEQAKCSLVVGDRLELMRFNDYQKWVDLDMLDKSVMSKYGEELSLFFTHLRSSLQKLWLERNSGWIHHHLEEQDKWDYSNITDFPQRACFTDSIDAYCVSHYNPKDHMFFNMVCGIIPFREIKDKPYFLPREHITLENINRNNIEDWILVYDGNDSHIDTYNKFMENDHYVLDPKLIRKFLTTASTLYDRILICTFSR